MTDTNSTKDHEVDENPREALTPVDPLTRQKYYGSSNPRSKEDISEAGWEYARTFYDRYMRRIPFDGLDIACAYMDGLETGEVGTEWHTQIGKALMEKLLREHPDIEWEKISAENVVGILNEPKSLPVETTVCLWQRDDPDNEFFFNTACGQEGVDRETSWIFCPHCGKRLTTSVPASRSVSGETPSTVGVRVPPGPGGVITPPVLTSKELREWGASDDVEKERMRAALKLIAEPSCERLTTGPGSCWNEPAWSPEAQYGSDKWCDACIALSALMPDAAVKRLPLEPTPGPVCTCIPSKFEATAWGGTMTSAVIDPNCPLHYRQTLIQNSSPEKASGEPDECDCGQPGCTRCGEDPAAYGRGPL